MKRGGYLKRYTPLKTKTKIRVKSHSETSETKDEIQDVLRDIVIVRDGGCILRDLAGTLFTPGPSTTVPYLERVMFLIPECGGYRKDGQMILQADHLITRGNAATYADSRLAVCVCKAHHGWKSLGSNLRKAQYDMVVKTIIAPERVTLWERCEADSWRPVHTGSHDWKLQLAALKQELRQLV